MGIAKRVHVKVVEGVIPMAQGERIVRKLLTQPAVKPVKGEQISLFGPATQQAQGIPFPALAGK